MNLDAGMVSRWVREYGVYEKNNFQEGNGNRIRTPEQEESARLKVELKQAQIERDIKKKAVSIFSTSDRANMNS